MDLYERQDLREFLVYLFGSQANGWNMSEGLFDLTYKLIQESGQCSAGMNFVPRPMPPGASAMKYLKKQVREIFLRAISKNKDLYVICVKAAAWKMINEFRMAARGL